MDVLGLEGRYEVFEDGTVWSKERKAKNQYSNKQQLKPSKGKHGYLEVRLYDGIKYHVWLVHRLIASHFISNIANKRTVNHIDGNKLNNHVLNLEWNTDSENQKHAISMGLSKPTKVQITLMNMKRRKFSIWDIEDIKLLYFTRGDSMRKIAKDFGVSYSTIRDILKGKNYVS